MALIRCTINIKKTKEKLKKHKEKRKKTKEKEREKKENGKKKETKIPLAVYSMYACNSATPAHLKMSWRTVLQSWTRNYPTQRTTLTCIQYTE